jgi:Na+/pantothenate symporter
MAIVEEKVGIHDEDSTVASVHRQVQDQLHHQKSIKELEMWLALIVIAQRTLTPLREPHIALSKLPFGGKEFGILQATIGRLYSQTEDAIETMGDFIEAQKRVSSYELAARSYQGQDRRLNHKNHSNQGAE